MSSSPPASPSDRHSRRAERGTPERSEGGHRIWPSSISYAQDSFAVAGSTVTVMFLAGEIDTYTEEAVCEALNRVVATGSANIVIDLTGVCSCSVGGFAMLVETARAVRSGGRHFALVAGSAELTTVEALEWPERMSSRHASVASAVAAIRARGRVRMVGPGSEPPAPEL